MFFSPVSFQLLLDLSPSVFVDDNRLWKSCIYKTHPSISYDVTVLESWRLNSNFSWGDIDSGDPVLEKEFDRRGYSWEAADLRAEWSASGDSVRQFKSMVILRDGLKRSKDVSASSIRLIISPEEEETIFDEHIQNMQILFE